MNNVVKKGLKLRILPDEEMDHVLEKNMGNARFIWNNMLSMYIVEYIDKNEQEKLMEDINMEAETEGVFAQLKREHFNECKKGIVDHLLENHTLEEVANFAEIPVSDILDIINK